MLPLPRPFTVIPQEQCIVSTRNTRRSHVCWRYRCAFLLSLVMVMLVILDVFAARAAALHESIHRVLARPNVPYPGSLENRQLGLRVESFALRGEVAVALLSGLDEDLLLVHT